MSTIKRGEIYYANLNPVVGSEQGGIRPVVIIQNNKGNKYSHTTIVAPITSRKKARIPTHVIINNPCLKYVSLILLEQIRIIDKARLKKNIGRLTDDELKKIDIATAISLAIKTEKEVSENEI